MSDAPADRLKKLRLKKGYETARDAARAFGWSEVTYRSHENATRPVTLNAARRYAQGFGSTVAYILGERGLGPVDRINHVVNVNVVARVSAGTFRYDEGLEEGAYPVPAVPRDDIPASSQYAVIIDGSSVNKRIPDGAYAICAKFDSYPGGAQHGQLVHVVRERAGLHEHTIKEIRYGINGAELWPVSTDPKHQKPLKLASGDEGEVVRIQGVVIGIFQPL